ncbi:mechanosensitive ion channel domain-containing protein [Rubripirellula lacrimiformis]|uniref:mechanosensitive ion channel domain-containing protein n=1 Tax=Rubripirellula lacrimiformis TaxID=1930273 RepID=UPI001FEB3B37|nr:mechanosensitive ion channel domain-containing protein [Rubripirellula lacrimiformis]
MISFDRLRPVPLGISIIRAACCVVAMGALTCKAQVVRQASNEFQTSNDSPALGNSQTLDVKPNPTPEQWRSVSAPIILASGTVTAPHSDVPAAAAEAAVPPASTPALQPVAPAPATAVQPVAVAAVPPASTPLVNTHSTLTVEQIEHAIQEIIQSGVVNAETNQAKDNYQAAIRNLQSAAEKEASEKHDIAETESVAARVDSLKQQRDELKDKKPTLDPKLNLKELEQLLPQWELLLSSQKKARQAAESENQARAQRRKDIRARVPQVQERIADAKTQLQTIAQAEQSMTSDSYATKLLSRRVTLEKELPALEAELAKFDAEELSDILRLKIDIATMGASLTEKSITLLQQKINQAREIAAEQSVRKARLEAIAAAPAMKEHAAHNQSLAERAKAVAESLASTQRDLKEAEEVHDGLIRQFGQARKKVDSVGLTSSVGAMLRKQKSNLPNVSNRRAAVAERHSLINDIQYAIFEYEDQRQELGDPDALIASMLSESAIDPKVDPSVREAAAKELIARQAEYLDTLIRASSQYFDTLIELDTTDQQVLSTAYEYEKYIDERVLWIRSGRAITADFGISPSDTWLVTPAKWSEAGTVFVSDAKDAPWIYFALLLPIAGLIVRRNPMRARIAKIGKAASRANCREITPTWKAIGLTIIVSLAWPALCAFVGWRLKEGSENTAFTESIGHGLLAVSVMWCAMEIFRQTCRPLGLGVAHFGWSPETTKLTRRLIRSFTLFALPLTFVTTALAHGDPGRDATERIVFSVIMLGIAFAAFRLLSPKGVAREYFQRSAGSWIQRLKYTWAVTASLIPLSLAFLALAGYHYTAQVLASRLFATCVFMAALFVIRSLLHRMVLMRRRYLSIEQLRQRSTATENQTEGRSTTVAGIVTDDPQADISAQSLQSRRLISTGLLACAIMGMWLIWVQVLPALSMLDHYPIWPQSTQNDTANFASVPSPSMIPIAQGTDPEASPIATISKVPEEVATVSDLAFAIMIAIVTVVLSRNGPGLLEITVLQRLPVDASVRYAITTLVSYAIVMIGTIAACSTIGLKWSQIQWLATALTFGLAFGLQEIFANFVAGLIILLERPIRVGDIVTIDEVTGVVSRIRIRATSITNWDRKEYVVPNKEFITGRLLNWTLTDKVNRIVIEVGVAYGTNTDRARELLLKVANDHPLILKDPASVAAFEGFGDSALNLVLKTYLANMDDRLETIHQLHTAINLAFRDEGIEIAFPQRDLHVRTATGILAGAPSQRVIATETPTPEPNATSSAAADAAETHLRDAA